MAWQTPVTTWGQAGKTVPGVDDFNRMEGNIDILGKYDRAPGYGTATGTNTKTITLSPAPGSYYDGLCFAFKNTTENTGAVTINVNGMGAKSVKKPNGNDLVSGNLKAGSVYTVRYNGTNFILQGEGGEYGNAQPGDVLTGKTIGTEEGIKSGTMPNQGAKIITPTTTNQAIGAGYHNGQGYVIGDGNLVPGNIKEGIPIFGKMGTFITQGGRIARSLINLNSGAEGGGRYRRRKDGYTYLTYGNGIARYDFNGTLLQAIIPANANGYYCETLIAEEWWSCLYNDQKSFAVYDFNGTLLKTTVDLNPAAYIRGAYNYSMDIGVKHSNDAMIYISYGNGTTIASINAGNGSAVAVTLEKVMFLCRVTGIIAIYADGTYQIAPDVSAYDAYQLLCILVGGLNTAEGEVIL